MITKDTLKDSVLEDSYYESHQITKIIGEGGQGLVCTTQTPDIVIKLITDNTGCLISKKNPKLFDQYLKKFSEIRLLPLKDNMHVSVPVATLNDYAGYVMREMIDMTCFKSLLSKDSFLQTGGHRRRLELLSKISGVLAQLHASGLVYGDISPNNIFITGNPSEKNQNVWLIDADNIAFQGNVVYTERYAAPEVILRKTPCTQNSDVYAFAVLAFESLAWVHPFAGNAVDTSNIGSASDDWDKTVTSSKQLQGSVNKQFSGKLPWIEDTLDTSNKTDDGFPRDIFLNAQLRALFNETFTNGRMEPAKRPTIHFWTQAFALAADTSIQCDECKMSHIYLQENSHCPWCKKLLQPMLLIFKNDKIVFAKEMTDTTNIPQRIFVPFDLERNSIPAITIKIEKLHGEQLLQIEKKDSFSPSEKVSYTFCLDIVKTEEPLKSKIIISFSDKKTKIGTLWAKTPRGKTPYSIQIKRSTGEVE